MASKIRVTTNAFQVKGCRSLGTVTRSWNVYADADPQHRDAGESMDERYLRIETSKRGGNTALASTQPVLRETHQIQGKFGSDPYTVTDKVTHGVGEAYACPAAP